MNGHPKDALAEACGLAGPLELLVSRPEEGGRGRRCLFERPTVLVGRDRSADLRLEEARVGRRHAYLQMVAGQLFCVDLDSRTGTHWEDGPRPSGWLVPGRAVRIGPFEISLLRAGGREGDGAVGPPPAWSATETRLLGPPASPRAVVEFTREGQTEASCRLTRVLTLVGRSSGCRLRLSSPEVSRYHCALLRTPAGVWAIDLQGRGGIRVAGQPVPWARLADGDRVEVGTFVMCLRNVFPMQPASALASAARPRSLTPPVRRAASDPTELSPVLQQLAAMQEQMFDQYQQAMLAMVQMFGALHREEMSLVREELDRLRALTQELHGLKAELGTRPAPIAPPLGVGNGTAAPGAAPPPGTAAPAPAAPPGAVGNGIGAAGGPPPPAGAAPASAAAGTPPAGKEKETANGTAAADPTRPADGNIHGWLSQRIAALEAERQSRWQKLMNAMLGK